MKIILNNKTWPKYNMPVEFVKEPGINGYPAIRLKIMCRDKGKFQPPSYLEFNAHELLQTIKTLIES